MDKFLKVLKIIGMGLLLAVPFVLLFVAKNILTGARTVSIKAEEIILRHDHSEVNRDEYISEKVLQGYLDRITRGITGR